VEANAVSHSDIHAYNTFDEPSNVKEEAFKGYTQNGDRIKVTLPACSVVEIRVK